MSGSMSRWKPSTILFAHVQVEIMMALEEKFELTLDEEGNLAGTIVRFIFTIALTVFLHPILLTRLPLSLLASQNS